MSQYEVLEEYDDPKHTGTLRHLRYKPTGVEILEKKVEPKKIFTTEHAPKLLNRIANSYPTEIARASKSDVEILENRSAGKTELFAEAGKPQPPVIYFQTHAVDFEEVLKLATEQGQGLTTSDHYALLGFLMKVGLAMENHLSFHDEVNTRSLGFIGNKLSLSHPMQNNSMIHDTSKELIEPIVNVGSVWNEKLETNSAERNKLEVSNDNIRLLQTNHRKKLAKQIDDSMVTLLAVVTGTTESYKKLLEPNGEPNFDAVNKAISGLKGKSDPGLEKVLRHVFLDQEYNSFEKLFSWFNTDQALFGKIISEMEKNVMTSSKIHSDPNAITQKAVSKIVSSKNSIVYQQPVNQRPSLPQPQTSLGIPGNAGTSANSSNRLGDMGNQGLPNGMGQMATTAAGSSFLPVPQPNQNTRPSQPPIAQPPANSGFSNQQQAGGPVPGLSFTDPNFRLGDAKLLPDPQISDRLSYSNSQKKPLQLSPPRNYQPTSIKPEPYSIMPHEGTTNRHATSTGPAGQPLAPPPNSSQASFVPLEKPPPPMYSNVKPSSDNKLFELLEYVKQNPNDTVFQKRQKTSQPVLEVREQKLADVMFGDLGNLPPRQMQGPQINTGPNQAGIAGNQMQPLQPKPNVGPQNPVGPTNNLPGNQSYNEFSQQGFSGAIGNFINQGAGGASSFQQQGTTGFNGQIGQGGQQSVITGTQAGQWGSTGQTNVTGNQGLIGNWGTQTNSTTGGQQQTGFIQSGTIGQQGTQTLIGGTTGQAGQQAGMSAEQIQMLQQILGYSQQQQQPVQTDYSNSSTLMSEILRLTNEKKDAQPSAAEDSTQFKGLKGNKVGAGINTLLQRIKGNSQPTAPVVYPTTPVAPVVRPTIPVQPNIPVAPVYPIQPVYPVQPVLPVYPVQPIQPVQPVRPVQPVYPVQPVQPVQPQRPIQPAPVQPVYPPQPVQPAQPLQPAQPTVRPQAPEPEYIPGPIIYKPIPVPVQTSSDDLKQFLDYAKQIEKKLDNLERKIVSQEANNSMNSNQTPKPNGSQGLRPANPPAPQDNRPEQQPEQAYYEEPSPKMIAVRRVPKLRPRIVETFRPRLVETREVRPVVGAYANNHIIEGIPYTTDDHYEQTELRNLASVERVPVQDSYYTINRDHEVIPSYVIPRSNSTYIDSGLYQTEPVYRSAARLATSNRYNPIEVTPGIIPRARNSSLSTSSYRLY